MLVIRLNRTGKRNRSQFRIALQEHTIAPGGKHIEILGSWDPHQKKGVFKAEKIKEWIGKGAQPSDTVQNLLINQRIIEGKKRAIKMKRVMPEEGKTEVVAGEKTATTEKKDEVKAEEPKMAEVAPEEKKETPPEVKKEEVKTENVKVAKEKKPEEKKEEVKSEE